MNKKEVLEIRKLFSKDNCRIERICGCYVDGHKEKKLEMKEAFLSLPEEEMFKYIDLFRKTLSGTIGRNLLNLEFPLEEEMPGGRQQNLLALRDSQLQDQEMLDAFYDGIISTYLYPENYLILLIFGSYDIPSRASDNQELFDASDYVYQFLLCSICPVNLSKPGLCYDEGVHAFVDKIQDWMVQRPDAGFLFPAFNDRNTDLHSLLYYSRNAGNLHPEIPGDLLGCSLPLPAEDQKTAFNSVVEETFGRQCDFETARNIHENLNQLLEEKKDDPEPLELDRSDVKRLLADCGAEQEQLEHFEEEYDSQTGGHDRFMAANLASTRKFEVKTSDVTVSVAPDKSGLVETRVLDGVECLVIPLTDQVEVNGIRIRHE
jgi:hypothetical protein